MKKHYTIFIILTLLNIFITSCGNKADAENGYTLQNLFGYECITNGVSIWCN